MDLPDSDPLLYAQTLVQFAFVNRWLTRARYLIKHRFIRQMQLDPSRSYHLVELGAGGCETAAWLLEQCKRRGLNLRVTAIDRDPRAIAFARKRYGHIENLCIVQGDLESLRDVTAYDYFYANHLLHHLEDEQIVHLFRILRAHPKAEILINDIHRTRSAYIAYYIFSAIFLRHSFARYDGLLSIRKGFWKPELRQFLRASSPDQPQKYRIKCIFPARIVICGKAGSDDPELPTRQ